MHKQLNPAHANGDNKTHHTHEAVPSSDCILVTPILWHLGHFILTGKLEWLASVGILAELGISYYYSLFLFASFTFCCYTLDFFFGGGGGTIVVVLGCSYSGFSPNPPYAS